MTEAEIEQLCLQLQRKGGADVHTANKAQMYLKMFFRDKTGFKDGSFDAFVALIRGAVYHDEWKPLADRMARWW